MKYCIIDTESGSRRLESTLLSAFFLIVDEEFTEIDQLYLQVKPDTNCLYIVDAQGMNVNKINLVEHDRVAITYKQAKPLLYEFLKKHSTIERLTPVGHAVKGDIKRITMDLISQGSWDQFCTYHYIDTSVVLQFLRACDKMPYDCDGSVAALADYFGIEIEGDLHDARVDAKTTAKILKEFIALGEGPDDED